MNVDTVLNLLIALIVIAGLVGVFIAGRLFDRLFVTNVKRDVVLSFNGTTQSPSYTKPNALDLHLMLDEFSPLTGSYNHNVAHKVAAKLEEMGYVKVIK